MTTYQLNGPEFLVNTEATANQSDPDITGLANGGYVVAWSNNDQTQDGDGYAAKAQIYAADGSKLGGEFLVNSGPALDQYAPKVSALEEGGFVAVWWERGNSLGQDSTNINARVFDDTGQPLGPDFLVNTLTEKPQVLPDVAALKDGGFVATWYTTDPAQDGSEFAIKAQRFDASGNTVGSEFLVNSDSQGRQFDAQVTALDNGGFAIVWRSEIIFRDVNNFYIPIEDIKGQAFDADGNPVGNEFFVNQQTTDSQYSPSISSLEGGGFAVAWATSNIDQDGNGGAIKARIFDDSGSPLGNEFLVNTKTEGSQSQVDLTSLPGGGFLATWEDGNGNISAQVFDGNGAKLGEELTVNTETIDRQEFPAVTALQGGNVVVAWSSKDPAQDGDITAIKAQMFEPSDTPLPEKNIITGGPNGDALDGTDLADDISGLAGADSIRGFGGDDCLDGGEGNDTLRGQDGNDDLSGGADSDLLFGNSGQDTLNGEGGADVLFGNTGNDSMFGGDGNDQISGNEDNDTLNGGAGDDSMFGGDGNDRMRGDEGADLLQGDDGADLINGGDDNDEIFGGKGNDALRGDGGNDLIIGNQGDDRLDGGANDDRLFGIGDNDTIEGGDGADVMFGGTGDDSLLGDFGADKLFGEDGDDWLDGGFDDDKLYGGADNDRLIGGRGQDQLFGDDGNDVVIGGSNEDTLFGGAGDDTIYGGPADFVDRATGGSGADVFQIKSGDGRLVVTDFDAGEGDLIDLFGIDLAGFAGWSFAPLAGGSSTLIEFTGGEELRLDGVSAEEVEQDWFI